MTRRARDRKARQKRKQPSAGDNDQPGKALLRRIGGDTMQVNFPDNGAKPLKTHVPRHQKQSHNGFGSHMNGKHKQG